MAAIDACAPAGVRDWKPNGAHPGRPGNAPPPHRPPQSPPVKEARARRLSATTVPNRSRGPALPPRPSRVTPPLTVAPPSPRPSVVSPPPSLRPWPPPPYRSFSSALSPAPSPPPRVPAPSLSSAIAPPLLPSPCGGHRPSRPLGPWPRPSSRSARGCHSPPAPPPKARPYPSAVARPLIQCLRLTVPQPWPRPLSSAYVSAPQPVVATTFPLHTLSARLRPPSPALRHRLHTPSHCRGPVLPPAPQP